MTVSDIVTLTGVTERTVRKWVRRAREESETINEKFINAQKKKHAVQLNTEEVNQVLQFSGFEDSRLRQIIESNNTCDKSIYSEILTLYQEIEKYENQAEAINSRLRQIKMSVKKIEEFAKNIDKGIL